MMRAGKDSAKRRLVGRSAGDQKQVRRLLRHFSLKLIYSLSVEFRLLHFLRVASRLLRRLPHRSARARLASPIFFSRVSRRSSSAGDSSPRNPRVVRVFRGVRRLGLARFKNLGAQLPLPLPHPAIAHSLVLTAVGLHLGAVQGRGSRNTARAWVRQNATTVWNSSPLALIRMPDV
jgi:hypothetical protein